MNHLKPFLEYYNNAYYRKIDGEEFLLKLYCGSSTYNNPCMVDFNGDNLNKLVTTLTDNNYQSINKSLRNYYTINTYISNKSHYINIYPTYSIHITIYEIPDEWYLIIIDDINRKQSYYECDQFEGLLQFFKDNKYFIT